MDVEPTSFNSNFSKKNWLLLIVIKIFRTTARECVSEKQVCRVVERTYFELPTTRLEVAVAKSSNEIIMAATKIPSDGSGRNRLLWVMKNT